MFAFPVLLFLNPTPFFFPFYNSNIIVYYNLYIYNSNIIIYYNLYIYNIYYIIKVLH